MNKTIKFTVLFFVLLFLINPDILGQIDKRFWFVAPETTRAHNKAPGVLRVTAFENAANVTISMPTNPDFQPIQLNVPANSQLMHEFHDAVIVRDGRVIFEEMLWTIENGTMDALSGEGYSFPNDWQGWSAGTPFNKGILIESDEFISVYYEVANGSNPERFNLKGGNALGTEFLIPSQNIYVNHQNTPNAREKVDIVATEDNTVITIELTDDHAIEGHAAGSTFTITLNRGQTYSLRSTSRDRRRHLGGTYITSNRPIAVTISDDSIAHRDGTSNTRGMGHYDLVGDQLVPISIIGTEYIAMHTAYNTSTVYESTDQKVFIWAATDQPGGTQVSVNGVATGPRLGRGEFVMTDISNNAIYITATAPVYVYQFASFRYELGSAILPAINCTGSRQVSFQKINNADFLVQIMTQYKYRNDLVMLPSETHAHLNDLNWVRVPGTGPAGHEDTWYSAVKNFPQNTISTERPYTIMFNPSIPDHYGLFHLSILDANGASMSYGYFSSYNQLHIDGPSMSCRGSEITLSTNQAGVDLMWFHESNPGAPFATAESVTVTESGLYWVEMQYSGCVASDQLNVQFAVPEFDLGEDQILCPGEELSFEFNQFTSGETFQWTLNGEDFSADNNFSLTIEPSTTYVIGLTVTDEMGCYDTQTITARGLPAPIIDWNIGETNDICLGDEIRNLSPNHRYEWSFNGTVLNPGEPEQNYIEPTESGLYSLTVWTEEECLDTYSRQINVNPLPVVELNDIEVCHGETGTFTIDGALYETIRWHNNETGSSITLSESVPEVSVTVTNEYGCEATATAEFTVHNQIPFDYEDVRICAGVGFDVEVDGSLFSNIVWQFNSEPPYTTDPENINSFLGELDEEGTYTITAVDNNGCDVSSTFDVEIYIGNPPLEIENFNEYAESGFMCSMDTIRISTPGHMFSSYKWSFREVTDPVFMDIGDEPYIIATVPGIYRLEATETFGCRNEDEIEVELYPQPEFYLFDVTLCPGTEEFRFEIDWLFVDGLDILNVQWLHDTDEEATSITVPNVGTYTVTVWDERGCFRTESAAAEHYIVPTINLTDIEFCDNESRIISLSDVVDTDDIRNHTWSWASGSSTDNDISITESGEYTLTVEDNNLHFDENFDEIGCFTSVTFTATMNPSPVFSLGEDRAVCIGETITIEIDDTYTRYEWGGNAEDDQPAFYVLTTPGENSVNLQVWNEHNCSSSSSLQVNVIEHPVVNLPDIPTKCAGESTDLSVGFNPNNYSIYWDTPKGYIRDTNSIQAEMGRYAVSVTDQYGCRSVAETFIDWIELPRAYFSPEDVEALCPIDLPFIIELGGDIDQFQEITWHDNRFFNEYRRPANILDTVNVAYIRDLNNCLSMLTHTVHLQQPNFFMVGDTVEACEPELIVLDGGEFTFREGSDDEIRYDIIEYNWFLNSRENPIAEADQQHLEIHESGRYIVEVFDGCWVLTDTFDVSYYPSPIIAGLDTMFYAQVTAFVEGGTMPYSYVLNDGIPQTNHTFMNVPNGEHIIWVEDAHGCETFAVFNLDSDYDIEIPNFFTPNGDGINDDWIIEGLERLPESIVYIYNRYGKLLRKFKAADQPWDGTYLNRPLPSDDYWYVIHLLPVDKYIRGNVTLIR
ncbi:T9SS type B sorting domain-containing protein [Natronoflexus pectinivorans]|uniref:Gliding motility-associated-like protein n=1 Tax=Natronoflexus pectinivorans TaxID=682526 RepID=A0A4R2G9J8_9BACT|nr:T9SS type B sorting domain-containing protein [Natronoflexus pectinivorans]TCO04453.1 gliding motility-associated-like protein [Natronoflexus pectinivorans]